MITVNPFLIDYSKKEDKVTGLLMHVLEKCDCIPDFLASIDWENEHDFSQNKFEDCGLQLHKDFDKPVKKAFILGISNDEIDDEDSNSPSEKVDGNPDAYMYDKEKEVLILIEVKVGKGKLTEDQLERHQLKVKNKYLTWTRKTILWSDVEKFFAKKLDNVNPLTDPLRHYIISNFIGVLNQDVVSTTTTYNKEYFLQLAGEYRLHVERIIEYIEKNYDGYIAIPYKGSHKEIRYICSNNNKTRFVTFVLSGKEPRFILHPGSPTGYNWRMKISKKYGIHFVQKTKDNTYKIYESELSIPLSAIDPQTLKLKPKEGYQIDDNDDLRNLKSLINKTVEINKNLNKFIKKKHYNE
jgi:hypothetical protein